MTYFFIGGNFWENPCFFFSRKKISYVFVRNFEFGTDHYVHDFTLNCLLIANKVTSAQMNQEKSK